LKAFAALGGMFVLGAVSSAGVYHAMARHRDAEFFSGDRNTFEARLVDAMSRELDLSGDQTTKIRGIFQSHADERKRLLRQEMETCGGAMNAHRERIDAEIRAVLTPPQRERFEAMRLERRRRLFGDPPPIPSAR
jgi:Spy/CpxP family protein refolding chaperone